MLQTKALKLLSKLDSTEFKGFLRFLQSPVFNKSNRVIALYNLLKKYYPAFDSPKLEREKIYAKLYPNKKYSYQQFANLNSELARLVEEYYSHLALKADTFQQRKLLIQSYRDRDLYDLFEKETEELVAEVGKDAQAINFQLSYNLLYDLYFHPNTRKRAEEIPTLNLMAAHLDHYYLHAKLLLSVEMKSREKIFNEGYNIPLLNEVKSLASTKTDNPSLYFYYLLLKLIESDKEENFFQLKAYFLAHCDQVAQPLKISIFRILNNFCLAAIRNGGSKFAFEHIELYEFGFEKELILVNGKISTFSFLNAITSGILCDKIKWVKEFIKNYQEYISPATKQEIMTMTKAFIAFHEQDYDQVTNLLFDFKPTVSTLNIISRGLICRAYFEVLIKDDSYYELYLSNLESFNKYIYRTSDLNQNRIKSSLNFIHYMKQLGKLLLENKNNETSLNQLQLEIKNTKPITSQSWFISRIEKIKQSSKSPIE